MSKALFVTNPVSIHEPRSKFSNTFKHVTSGNYGRLYPIYSRYVMPGDTLKLDINAFVRGATPLQPVFSDSECEIVSFFVPFRIIWNKAKQFFGENDTSAWTQTVTYSIPKVKLQTGAPTSTMGANIYEFGEISGTKYGFTMSDCDVNMPNKLADYLGFNPGYDATFIKSMITDNKSNAIIPVNCFKFRAYWQIWNDHWRDQNYMAPILFSKDSTDITLSTDVTIPYTSFKEENPTYSSGWTTSNINANSVLYVCKKQDSFTTILPQPLKGPEINLLELGGLVPITTGDEQNWNTQKESLKFKTQTGTAITGVRNIYLNAGRARADTPNYSAETFETMTPSNLWADLKQAGSLTIENIRIAAATTQLYEALARGGSRYQEVIRSLFGVTPSDKSIQISEILGSKKFTLTQYQVTNTAGANNNLGETGAFSYTQNKTNGIIFKSFDDWGIVLTCATMRIEHQYPNICDPEDLTTDMLDLYFPPFDHIGEQGIKYAFLNPQALAKDQNGNYYHTNHNANFGYQEAWWYLRFKENQMSGIINKSNPHSLSYWTYSDNTFDPFTQPGPNWILARSDERLVNETLQLGSQASGYAMQWIGNFEFQETLTRRMSIRSEPGLWRI